MKVLFLPEVEEYLVELTDILYQKEYFGFKENAIQYITELVQEIVVSLPTKHKKLAPTYFGRYGDDLHYSSFKRNQNTQWYVFFTIYEKEQVCLVRYMGTNHTIAQYL